MQVVARLLGRLSTLPIPKPPRRGLWRQLDGRKSILDFKLAISLRSSAIQLDSSRSPIVNRFVEAAFEDTGGDLLQVVNELAWI